MTLQKIFHILLKAPKIKLPLRYFFFKKNFKPIIINSLYQTLKPIASPADQCNQQCQLKRLTRAETQCEDQYQYQDRLR